MKRLSIRITFVIIALAAAAAVVTGDLARHAAGRKLREAILAELQPVALKNCTLKRFDSANDGGYLMCENLMGMFLQHNVPRAHQQSNPQRCRQRNIAHRNTPRVSRPKSHEGVTLDRQ